MRSEQLSDGTVAEVALPRSPSIDMPPRWRTLAGIATRVVYTLAGLFIFILALQLMKTGAKGLKPILESLSADGVLNLLGFGWLGSYVVLSGSPVAAISLSLYSSGTTSDVEAFAMINGSRLGASFIVLFIGFMLWVTKRKSADGLYIGVVALLCGISICGVARALAQPTITTVRFSVFSAKPIKEVGFAPRAGVAPQAVAFAPTARSPRYEFRGAMPLRFV
ncbi:MAG: hypothetical protein AAB092_08825, partial [Chloroflexota bacterium]